MPTLPPERSVGYLWRWCSMARAFMASLIIRPSSDIVPEYVGGLGVLLHLTRRGVTAAETETAWDNALSGSSVAISHGPVMWGDTLVDPDWALNTSINEEVAPQSVDLPTVTGTENRWLYVSADLTQAETSGSVTCAFMDDTALPVDDVPGLIAKRPLSLWKITTADGSTTAQKLFNAEPPFATQLASVYGPPRAS